ncbi:MAG: NAD(P)/FAD-dependent oxidoreductase [Polyangiaceae bacterium]
MEMDREARAARRMSRRTMLGAAAAGAALAALPGCEEDAIGTPAAGPIVIVGGGMAGLHCAYRLAEQGFASTVYEAASRVGGRMFTDRTTFPDDQHCELGGELIDTGHTTMLDLAEELGIELYDYDEDDASLETLVAFIAGAKLTMAEILEGFAPIAAKIDEALATLTDQDDLYVYYDNPNGGEALDAMSLADWFDSIGAEGPVRTLLEVAYNIEYGLEPDVTNALNMIFLISTSTEEFEAFGDSDERFHAKDGNDTFITALADSLDPAQIELEAQLVALNERADGTYVLTFDRGGSSFEVGAGHVVLALPFTKLRQVETNLAWSESKALAINELGYGTNAKLMVGFSSRPWRSTHGSNGETFSDLPFQSTWETSRLQPGDSGIITNFTGGGPGVAAGVGTPQERAADFLNQFEQLFPGAKAAANGAVARFHWPTYPLTLGSYSAYKVGQYTTITGVEIERHRNIHFAGEHTSLDAQGYMEGAALTGAMAAEEIGADLSPAEKEPQAWGSAGGAVVGPAERIRLRAALTRAHRRHRLALRRLARGR